MFIYVVVAGRYVEVITTIERICYARKQFDDFAHPDVFVWNAIIRSY